MGGGRSGEKWGMYSGYSGDTKQLFIQINWLLSVASEWHGPKRTCEYVAKSLTFITSQHFLSCLEFMHYNFNLSFNS